MRIQISLSATSYSKGQRVACYWGKTEGWYLGTVVGSGSKGIRVKYDDGTTEWEQPGRRLVVIKSKKTTPKAVTTEQVHALKNATKPKVSAPPPASPRAQTKGAPRPKTPVKKEPTPKSKGAAAAPDGQPPISKDQHEMLKNLRVKMHDGTGTAMGDIGEAAADVLTSKKPDPNSIKCLLATNNYGGVVTIYNKTTNKTKKSKEPGAADLLKRAVLYAKQLNKASGVVKTPTKGRSKAEIQKELAGNMVGNKPAH